MKMTEERIFEIVRAVITSTLEIDDEKVLASITKETEIGKHLGADSSDLLCIALELEKQHCIPRPALGVKGKLHSFLTVGDVCNYVNERIESTAKRSTV